MQEQQFNMKSKAMVGAPYQWNQCCSDIKREQNSEKPDPFIIELYRIYFQFCLVLNINIILALIYLLNFALYIFA